MKYKLTTLLLVLLCFVVFTAKTQTAIPDKIIGNWISPEKDLIVQCYKHNNKYYGKIIWFKEYFDNTPDNPDALPESQWKSTVVMKDFVYQDNEWSDGKIFQLKTCKTYDAFIKLKNENTLQVTGFVFFRFLSETISFSRYFDTKLPS
jgi:uncharacterized protein (DUF2147 family)